MSMIYLLGRQTISFTSRSEMGRREKRFNPGSVYIRSFIDLTVLSHSTKMEENYVVLLQQKWRIDEERKSFTSIEGLNFFQLFSASH